MKHKTGFVLLVIGGALMIYSSVRGEIKIFETLYTLASNEWPDYEPLFNIIVNVIFRWIADLGGVAVITGAILIVLGQVRLGKFIIWIGLAFGTLALIIWITTQIVRLTGVITDPTIVYYLEELYTRFSYGSGLGFAGVVIAIIGRAFVRRVKPKKVEEVEEEEEEVKIEEEEETEITEPLEKKFCPECGTELPVFSNFCSNCGKVFD
ncbi:MAG: zinc-ribbon domain-containing protein [Candidatus Hermodarchaeota archaeon]